LIFSLVSIIKIFTFKCGVFALNGVKIVGLDFCCMSVDEKDFAYKRKSYIEPFGLLTETSPLHTRFDLWERFIKFMGEPNEQVFGLLGNSGGGKSLFSSFVLSKLIDHAQEKTVVSPNKSPTPPIMNQINPLDNWVPVYVQLRKYQDDPDHCIVQCLVSEYQLSPSQIDSLLITKSTNVTSLSNTDYCWKSKLKLLFILDGFDEINGPTSGDVMDARSKVCQQIHQFSNTCKLVVTSRTEYFSSNQLRPEQVWSLNPLTTVPKSSKATPSSLNIVYLSPFSSKDIQRVCDQFDGSSQTTDQPPNSFARISQVPGLQDLLGNPFTLNVVLQCLSKLLENRTKERRKFKVKRYEIYQAFIEDWFEKETKGLEVDELQWNVFIENVAVQMFKNQKLSFTFEQEASKRLLAGESEMLLLETSPLKKTGNEYLFIHKSIFEFLVCKSLINELNNQICSWGLWNHKLLPRDERSVLLFMSDFVRLERELKGLSSWFSRDQIKKFTDLSQQLGQTLKSLQSGKAVDIQERLMDLVLRSKHQNVAIEKSAEHEELDFEASGPNAISVLNISGFSFSGMCLSRVCIPGADLEGGVLHESDLSGSVLCGKVCGRTAITSLKGAHMDRAKLDESVFGTSLWNPNSQQEQQHHQTEARECEFGQLPSFLGHKNAVSGLTFSLDGSKLISCSHDKTIKVWDFKSGHCERTLVGHSNGINSLALRSDGLQLASGSYDQTIRIWNTKTWECELELKGHKHVVMSVSFSPNGSKIGSGSWDKTVRVWNTRTGLCEKVLEGHIKGVYSVSFSFDGSKIVSGSNDSTIKIWSTHTYLCESTLQGHTSLVRCVSFSKDGSKVFSSSDDSTIRMWDVKAVQCQMIFEGHSGPVHQFSLSEDEANLVSCSEDTTVRVWDTNSGHCVNCHQGHSMRVHSVIWTPSNHVLGQDPAFDGSPQIVSGSLDRSIRLWKGETSQTMGWFEQSDHDHHHGSINQLSFFSDGSKIVSCSDDKTVKVWDVRSFQCEMILNHPDKVTSVSMSNIADSGSKLVSGCLDGKVRMWVVKSGRCETAPSLILEKPPGPGGGSSSCSVSSVDISGDGAIIVSGSDDKTVSVWDTKTGKCLKAHEGKHQDKVTCVSISRDGTWIISGSSDMTIQMWRTQPHEWVREVSVAFEVNKISFSRDGSMFVDSNNERCSIWDTQSGQLVRTFTGVHTAWRMSASFSWDGSKVVTGSADKSICVWDVKTGYCETHFLAHREGVTSVLFSPNDPTMVVSGSMDHTLRFWDVSHSCWTQSSNLSVELQPTQSIERKEVRLVARTQPFTLSLKGLSLNGAKNVGMDNLKLFIQSGGEVMKNNKELNEMLQKDRRLVDMFDQDTRTLLMNSVEQKNLGMCKWLIENNADLNLKDESEETALYKASFIGNNDICSLLIKNKAGLDFVDVDNRSCLWAASSFGFSEIVKMLIENDADPNLKNFQGSTSLFVACERGQKGFELHVLFYVF